MIIRELVTKNFAVLMVIFTVLGAGVSVINAEVIGDNGINSLSEEPKKAVATPSQPGVSDTKETEILPVIKPEQIPDQTPRGSRGFRYTTGDTEYYADESGALYSNTWVEDSEGNWYYILEDGVVLKNAFTPDNYYVDEHGVCIPFEGEAGSREQILQFGYGERSLNLRTSTARIVWDFFKKRGWTSEAIAGVLGNFEQESSMDPALEETGGTGFGLGQWSYERRDAFFSYALSRGEDPRAILTQLNYILEEPGESEWVKAYASMKFSSPAEAAVVWARNWERYNEDGSLLRTRIPYAVGYYEYFAKNKTATAADQAAMEEILGRYGLADMTATVSDASVTVIENITADHISQQEETEITYDDAKTDDPDGQANTTPGPDLSESETASDSQRGRMSSATKVRGHVYEQTDSSEEEQQMQIPSGTDDESQQNG